MFYVSLLRHVGCTAFSHEEGAVFGDDNTLRGSFIRIDNRRASEVARTAIQTVGAGRGPGARIRMFGAVFAAREELANARLVDAHCDASRALARRLSMRPGVVEGLDHIFERGDGKGLPSGRRGEAVALSARVAHFAHTMVVQPWRAGPSAGIETARRRAGGEFDPARSTILLRYRDTVHAATRP